MRVALRLSLMRHTHRAQLHAWLCVSVTDSAMDTTDAHTLSLGVMEVSQTHTFTFVQTRIQPYAHMLSLLNLQPFVETWTHNFHTVNVVLGYCEQGDLGTIMSKRKVRKKAREALLLCNSAIETCKWWQSCK